MSNHPICSWQRSPLFAAMVDALTECGLHDQADIARITDAEVWAKKGDKQWPSRDKAVRDRFHALWTEKVQARCGVNPDQSPAETYNAGQTALACTNATRKALRDARAAEAIRYFEAGEDGVSIGRRMGLGKNTVLRMLRDVGLIPAPRSREARYAA